MLHPITSLNPPPRRRNVKDGRVFYHPELDVLRFFAFLAVFLHHALPRDPAIYIERGFSTTATNWFMAAKEAGAYGVDLFFVLSAYLITELLLREYYSLGRFSIPKFYLRRALRIWPLYFTFLAATVFVVPIILPDERFGPVYAISFAFFVGNWVSAAYGLPFSVASPLWSISVEEQFYIGWPLLLWVFGIHRIKLLAVAMLAIPVATRVALAAYGAEHPAVWCNTLARLDPIALGALLAVALEGSAPRITKTLRVVLVVVALASFLLVGRYLKQAGPTSVITFSITALAGVLLLLAILQKDTPLLRVPPFSWLVHLGRISYGLYIFHLFVLTFMAKMAFIPLLGIRFNYESRLVFSLLLTILLAALSYRLLERPFLKLKKRFSYDYNRQPAATTGSESDSVEPSTPDYAKVG